MPAGVIDKQVVDLCQKYARYVPGLVPSTMAGMWALETGWGDSPDLGGVLYREHHNFGCIKIRRGRNHQSGSHQGHGSYPSLEMSFRDGVLIIGEYQSQAPARGLLPGDILSLLNEWWAPHQDYARKVKQLVLENQLWRMDPRVNL